MEKINNLLIFESERFVKGCFDIYRNLVDENIKKAYDDIYKKLDSELKTNISQKIGGNDLFDYSDVEEMCIKKLDSELETNFSQKKK